MNELRPEQKDGIIVMCCACRRTRVADGAWERVEAPPVPLRPDRRRISHALCPPCYSTMTSEQA